MKELDLNKLVVQDDGSETIIIYSIYDELPLTMPEIVELYDWLTEYLREQRIVVASERSGI